MQDAKVYGRERHRTACFIGLLQGPVFWEHAEANGQSAQAYLDAVASPGMVQDEGICGATRLSCKSDFTFPDHDNLTITCFRRPPSGDADRCWDAAGRQRRLAINT